MARVTIADVAAKAQVSKSTVSHALSGKRSISEATRRRVHQAIAELGYRPDPVAQSLATRTRHRAIGFVFPLLAPEVAGLEVRFIASAAQVINRAGYAFTLMTHLDDNIGHLEQFAASGLAEGFLLMQVQMQDERAVYLNQRGIPFVLIGRCEENSGLYYVDCHIEQGIDRCVEQLVHFGHRQIAFLHQDDQAMGFSARAMRSFADACQRRSLESAYEPCDLNFASGEHAMARLLARRPETTAIIVWNDNAAAGAVEAALAHGLRIPADLSLICFNYSSISRLGSLQPTILDIRAEDVAAQAAHMLIRLLSGETLSETQVLIEPAFIQGQSIAPCSA
jgi:DNA-binding LacI/PurR family transcriptional regulator